METRQLSSIANQSFKFSAKEYASIKLVRQIGAGCYGKVYYANFTLTQSDIAVKCIDIPDRNATQITNACLKETDIMAILANTNAPNTIKLHGYFQSGCSYLIAMSYISYGSLEERLEETNDEQQQIIMFGVANALSHMHDYNIVHCDIKPANVLLNTCFEPFLCDFGLSKRIGVDDFKTPAGTPMYMAPELFVEKTGNSKASDIFSLSVTYWQIAERKTDPYPQLSKFHEFIDLVVKQGNRPSISSKTHPFFAKLITWGWAQHPTDRPTAKQVKESLEMVSDNRTYQSKIH